MTSASPDSVLLSSVEQAEKDLAMYAAIIGYKPTVEPSEPDPIEAAPARPEPLEPAHFDSAPSEMHHPHRIGIWMRHVSHEAKKRIHEAKMRLAS